MIRRQQSWEAMIVFGIAIFFVALFLFVGAQRITSGFRVYENYNATMIARVIHGGRLYPDPEISPVGALYAPLYFFLSAALAKIIPLGAQTGRLLSLGATLGTGIIIFSLVRQRTGRAAPAFWSAAFFFGSFGILLHQYDVPSSDPLLMMLTAATLFFLLRRTSLGDAAALFCAGCACFTKQTGLPMCVVTFGLVVAARRQAWVYLPVLFWTAAGLLLLLITHGRAWEYLVLYPVHHAWKDLPDRRLLVHFFFQLLPLWGLFLLFAFRKPRDIRLLLFAGAVLFSSISGIWKGGGGASALFPFMPILCAGAIVRHPAARIIALAQLVICVYNPFGALYPWSTFRDLDRQAVAVAKSINGEVWFPSEGYLAYEAGKREWDHFGAIESRCWGGYPPPQRLIDVLREKRIKAIILKEEGFEVFRRLPGEIVSAVDQGYLPEAADRLIIYRLK